MQRSSILRVSFLMAATACTRTASSRDIERSIADNYAKLGPVTSVTCPGPVPAEKGETFACTIQLTGGDAFPVRGTVTAAGGGKLEADYAIEGALIAAGPMAAEIAAELTKRSGAPATVDCGAPRRADARGKATCTATATDGSRATVEITLAQPGPGWSWQIGTPGAVAAKLRAGEAPTEAAAPIDPEE